MAVLTINWDRWQDAPSADWWKTAAVLASTDARFGQVYNQAKKTKNDFAVSQVLANHFYNVAQGLSGWLTEKGPVVNVNFTSETDAEGVEDE